MTFLAGPGTGLGHDYTVFATITGKVKFEHADQAQEAHPRRAGSGRGSLAGRGRGVAPEPIAGDHRRALSRSDGVGGEPLVKPDIHPKYYQAHVHCGSCGTEWTVGSTEPELRVDVCGNCHPFFTGKQTIIDTAGQVERFQKRLERQVRA